MTDTVSGSNTSRHARETAWPQHRRRDATAPPHRDRHHPGAADSAGRPGIPGQIPSARPDEPGPALRHQGDLFHRGRGFPAVQAGPEHPQRTHPAQVQRQGLLRPEARRRAEDDRRDPRGIRRRGAAARGARRRRGGELPARPDREGRRTRHHRDQHPQGLRRHRRTPLERDQRTGGRGTCLRRHGLGVAPAGAGRCGRRADPLGQRGSASHLSARVRRRECPAGVRGHRRTATAVRPHPAEDHRGTHAERLPAERCEVVGAGRGRRRAVRRRSSTQRQADTVHRRIGRQRPYRQSRSEHGYSGRCPGPA